MIINPTTGNITSLTHAEARQRISEAKGIGRERGRYVLADRMNRNPLRLMLGTKARIFTTSDRDLAERLAASFNRNNPRPLDVLGTLEWSMIRVPQLSRMCI
jgi:hypothetical protein